MHDLYLWQRRLRPLLIPPAALRSLFMRAKAALYAKNILPAWLPPAPSVCVGGLTPSARGKMMLSAWLLGWAEARGLRPALLAMPGNAKPPRLPFPVTPATPFAHCGPQMGLLARYRPGAAIWADTRPARAGKEAWKTLSPDLFILHDLFSDLSIRRQTDLVLLEPHDLDKGWNRPFPAGFWREGLPALARAAAFVLHIGPRDIPARKALIERRLKRLGKPVFTIHPRIWRLRHADGRTADTLNNEPYLLITPQSNQDMAAKAVQAFLGAPPRLKIVFPDSHRFTPQDKAQIAADAARVRTPHILATNDAFPILDGLPGCNLWTYDPDVTLGPCLLTGQAFTPWWDARWAGGGCAPAPRRGE